MAFDLTPLPGRPPSHHGLWVLTTYAQEHKSARVVISFINTIFTLVFLLCFSTPSLYPPARAARASPQKKTSAQERQNDSYLLNKHNIDGHLAPNILLGRVSSNGKASGSPNSIATHEYKNTQGCHLLNKHNIDARLALTFLYSVCNLKAEELGDNTIRPQE